MTYPEHIYDPTRRQLAEELMSKEFGKLFPDADQAALNHNIAGWHTEPEKYHMNGVMDFWDSFAALFEQVKLKPGFTHMFTAANASWSRREIEVKNIQMTSPLEQINRIPDLEIVPHITIGTVVTAAEEAGVVDEQKAINDSFSTDSQDAYPIIVRELPDGSQRVYDGNRRSIRAGLYKRPTIDAWVGTLDGDTPRDFWVPVGEMYQLVRYYRSASTDSERQTARNMLEVLFLASSIARINFELRIKNESESTAEFYAMKPTL